MNKTLRLLFLLLPAALCGCLSWEGGAPAARDARPSAGLTPNMKTYKQQLADRLLTQYRQHPELGYRVDRVELDEVGPILADAHGRHRKVEWAQLVYDRYGDRMPELEEEYFVVEFGPERPRVYGGTPRLDIGLKTHSTYSEYQPVESNGIRAARDGLSSTHCPVCGADVAERGLCEKCRVSIVPTREPTRDRPGADVDLPNAGLPLAPAVIPAETAPAAEAAAPTAAPAAGTEAAAADAEDAPEGEMPTAPVEAEMAPEPATGEVRPLAPAETASPHPPVTDVRLGPPTPARTAAPPRKKQEKARQQVHDGSLPAGVSLPPVFSTPTPGAERGRRPGSRPYSP